MAVFLCFQENYSYCRGGHYREIFSTLNPKLFSYFVSLRKKNNWDSALLQDFLTLHPKFIFFLKDILHFFQTRTIATVEGATIAKISQP